MIDVLDDVLGGVHARSAAFCRVELDAPWALRIADAAPLALVHTLRGEAWIVPDDEPAVRVGPGDVALVDGAAAYTVADPPGTEPTIVVGPGGVLRDLAGHPLPDDALGAAGRPGSTSLASGTYQTAGDVSRRLLDVLPRVLVMPGDHASLRLLADEVGNAAPAQRLMLDRLLDVALIETVRAWFARPGASPPGWYAAAADPVVGPALQLLHSNPAHGWTIRELAGKVGASRPSLARRFRDVVGEPPMTYLATWRIALAADLLRSSDLTIDAIAHRVGYGNGFALSVAFQRLRGIRPSEHRSGARSQVHVAR